MLVKIVVCLFLAVSYVTCDSIEDISFLNDAVAKYSPALIKDLIINRIEHTMGHIKSVNTSVGLNQDQRALCTAIYSALNILTSDINSIDKSQVICVSSGTTSSYTKTIKNYITQFSVLVETFTQQFETLKTPTLTQYTPDYLLDHLDLLVYNVDKTSSKDKEITKMTIESLAAYIEDIESKANETTSGYVQKVFASSIVRQLHNLTTEVSDLARQGKTSPEYKPLYAEMINSFKQFIDIFYRQWSMLAEIATSDDSSGVQLTAQ